MIPAWQHKIASVEVGKVTSSSQDGQRHLPLRCVPSDNSEHLMVKVIEVAIADCHGHNITILAFQHGGHSTVQYIGGENKRLYCFPDLVLSQHDYDVLSANPYLSVKLFTDEESDFERHIVKVEL